MWYEAFYIYKNISGCVCVMKMLRLDFAVVVRTVQVLLANTSIKPRVKSLSHLNEWHGAHQAHFIQVQKEAMATLPFFS